jgi:hypothetical protein
MSTLFLARAWFRSGAGKLFLLGLLALGVWLLVGVLPLATTLDRIIQVSKTTEQVTLAPGDVLKQAFRTNGGTYSGVVVSSFAATLADRHVQVRILNAKGQEIAKSYAVRTYYLPADDTLRLQFSLRWFKVAPHEELYEEITLLSGQPLPVKSSALNDKFYPEGRLFINGKPVARNVAVALVKPAPLSDGSAQGVMAGLFFALGMALVFWYVPRKHQWLVTGVLLVCVVPLALGGFWFSQDALGIADWDYYSPLHYDLRQIIVTYHHFPFWNPWICGGTAGLADPEFPVFTPTFLVELVAGIPNGLRLAIYLAVAVRALGLLMLAKRLKLSLPAAVVTTLGVTFSSVGVLELVEGHVNFFTSMWIPWIFWAWLTAYRQNVSLLPLKKGWAWLKLSGWEIALAGFLAITFYGGGIYLLMYTSLAFLVLPLLVSKPKVAMVTTVRAGILALGLVAVKLWPVLLWLKQFPNPYYTPSTTTLPWLYDILLGRNLHGSYIIFNQGTDWQEYGAYIGPFILALGLIGLAAWRKQRRIIWGLAAATMMTILLSSSGPAIKQFYDHLWFFPRSTISRIIYFAVMAIGLLAGFGVDVLRKKVNIGRLFLVIIIGLVAVDLMSLDYQLSQQSFILPHVYPLISPAPSPIAFTPLRYDSDGSGTRTTRSFDAAVAGYGTLTYCPPLGPRVTSVKTIYDEGNNGAVQTTDDSAKVTILSWSPNKVVVHVVSAVDTGVLLNTNYVKHGWWVNGQPATEIDNRVGNYVKAGDELLVFEYKTPGFAVGLMVTVMTLGLLGWFGWKGWRRKKSVSKNPS